LKTLFSVYRWLCIDIAAGSVACAIMAARVCNAVMPLSWYLLVPLAVWVIYLSDHVYDSRHTGYAGKIERDRFYIRHAIAINCLIGILLLGSLFILLIRIDWQIIFFGCIMLAFTCLYMILYILNSRNWIRWYPKEIMISTIYSLGIWGLPLMKAAGSHSIQPLLTFVVFFLLVLSNTMIFSRYEHEADKEAGSFSLSIAFGRPRVVFLVNILLCLSATVCIGLILPGSEWHTREVPGILSIMLLVLAAVNNFPQYFALHRRYAFTADGIFLLPFLLLII
jgi:4-hydroxybenzoate polyprenyltransferase